ncbi:peptide chain release factor N(5)-glutamine methyltransferase [Desulfopila sp. IMCC35006]|uniref:peptide chain release factor N(5)-glutamine methyltransferase n=1 Tax=Desulfopila sp. IMCC35006 TaxID=2569542 RepID=UPI0010AB6FA1|nr:peptide chain release factor N(5)-glutamine methyltransferase [Desulfopila sp. IMCC35006]TKB27965.1 peptide chain release factor N(5)-glutamine methyltransferase [Desulfopila sp. IMCC35006]
MRLLELLHHGQTELELAGVTEYELDARLLLEYCTAKTRAGIFLDGACEVDPAICENYLSLLERRKKREPLAYILGEQEFWSLPFHVTPDVLIPRPETEFLLDRVFALADTENFQKGHILDLCCGSGVIATILAKESGKKIIASDISFKALHMTRKNARRHRLESQVLPVQGHLLAPFSAGATFSLIVANPPYISSFDVRHSLMPEVAGHEPHLALDGGVRGLELIQQIRDALPTVLCPGGQCFIEIGADQGAEIKKFFSEDVVGGRCYQQVEILVDYAGRERVVHVRLGQ